MEEQEIPVTEKARIPISRSTATTASGFVAALTYGHLDERQKGSYEACIRYYDQPSASILYHTMDGDTTFFRHMDFRGWGARLDYILCPGLDWTGPSKAFP